MKHMDNLRFTLVTDGSGDRALIPLLQWLLVRHSQRSFSPQWPDLGRLRMPPKGLADRLTIAIELDPCDLLFVHRDAERQPAVKRREEISAALAETRGLKAIPIAVVPVRMSEAWLVWNEQAIRIAAGNPEGDVVLLVPSPRDVEELANPKEELSRLLRQASQASGRRLRDLRPEQRKHRVAELIADFSPLLAAPAFAELDQDVRRVVEENGWHQGRPDAGVA